MTYVQNQINKAVSYLKAAQQNFSDKCQWGHLNNHKLAVDVDIEHDSIVFFFSVDKNTGFTITLDAEFDGTEVTSLSINEIEVDTDGSLELISGEGQDDLLLECKRIIHDAVYYNITDDLTTSFYHEVYAGAV